MPQPDSITLSARGLLDRTSGGGSYLTVLSSHPMTGPLLPIQKRFWDCEGECVLQFWLIRSPAQRDEEAGCNIRSENLNQRIDYRSALVALDPLRLVETANLQAAAAAVPTERMKRADRAHDLNYR